MKVSALLSLSFLLIAFASCTQSQNWGADYDAVAKQPGAKVTLGKNNNGDATRAISLPSGVNIYQVNHDNKIQNTEVDESGHGAVMCAWGIYEQLRGILEICSPDGDKELKNNLDFAIDKINSFIVINSISPITKQSLEDKTQKGLMSIRNITSKMSKDEINKRCTSGDFGQMLKKIRTIDATKLKSDVNTLLSVPRPPVINPCL